MIDWSGISSKSIFGKLLRLPIRLVPKNLWVPVLQGPMKGMKWISGSSNAGCWLGSYELANQKAHQRIIKPGVTVFDIGANVGFFTLFFSKLVGKKGQVVAFEPFAENVLYLLRHMRKNNCRNVTVYQTAVSGRTGLASFFAGPSGSTGTIIETQPNPTKTSYYVPVVSLDELIEKHDMSVPDIIKMDVEGAESDVLLGARSLMDKKGPTWFISLHSEKQKEKCRHILEQFSYDLFLLNGEKKQLGKRIVEDDIYAVQRRKSR